MSVGKRTRMRKNMCMDICSRYVGIVCVWLFPPYHLSKEHVGGNIFCRQSTLDRFRDMLPVWLSCGPLGTDGVEGETVDKDIPETWGWTLSDVTLRCAVAVQCPECDACMEATARLQRGLPHRDTMGL